MSKRTSRWDDPNPKKKSANGETVEDKVNQLKRVLDKETESDANIKQSVVHDKANHAENKSNTNVVVCIICQSALGKLTMEQHVKRKHPAEFRIMGLDLNSKDSKSMNNSPDDAVPNKATSLQLENNLDQDDDDEKEEDEPIFIVHPKRAEITGERDEDGFFQLVITEF